MITIRTNDPVLRETFDLMFKPEIDIILEIVARYYGVSVDYIKKNKRDGDIVRKRHEVQYLCKVLTKASLRVIGKYTAEDGTTKDHATVFHAFMNVSRDLEHKLPTGKYVNQDKRDRIEKMKELFKEAVSQQRRPIPIYFKELMS